MQLFRKKIEPRCAYCEKGAPIGADQVACRRRGVVSAGEHCASFRYDPLKRVPPRPVKLATDTLKNEDFEL